MPSAADARRPRVLIALLVYNGREFVPRCLESARRLGKGNCEVDVLVLDDCSPDAEWSRDLSELSDSIGVQYYRSPRNLGIPRNMNLGLLQGLSAEYDYVIILNSDVVLPYNLADGLIAVAEANERVGSVTAWSNNCSIYSLPNSDPERFLSDAHEVDRMSEVLSFSFGTEGVEIPAAVGFCMLIPAAAAREVGLFDPVFGRGYCEELDWCLRAKAQGLRNLLAPNVFVYHSGSGSTRGAGLLARGETTVAAHEKVIDWRYPLFRQQVSNFGSSDTMDRLFRQGLREIVIAGAREFGYDVRVTHLSVAEDRDAHFAVVPDEKHCMITGYFRGFSVGIELPPERSLLSELRRLTERDPDVAVVQSRGSKAAVVAREAAEAGIQVLGRTPYPERI